MKGTSFRFNFFYVFCSFNSTFFASIFFVLNLNLIEFYFVFIILITITCSYEPRWSLGGIPFSELRYMLYSDSFFTTMLRSKYFYLQAPSPYDGWKRNVSRYCFSMYRRLEYPYSDILAALHRQKHHCWCNRLCWHVSQTRMCRIRISVSDIRQDIDIGCYPVKYPDIYWVILNS